MPHLSKQEIAISAILRPTNEKFSIHCPQSERVARFLSSRRNLEVLRNNIQPTKRFSRFCKLLRQVSRKHLVVWKPLKKQSLRALRSFMAEYEDYWPILSYLDHILCAEYCKRKVAQKASQLQVTAKVARERANQQQLRRSHNGDTDTDSSSSYRPSPSPQLEFAVVIPPRRQQEPRRTASTATLETRQPSPEVDDSDLTKRGPSTPAAVPTLGSPFRSSRSFLPTPPPTINKQRETNRHPVPKTPCARKQTELPSVATPTPSIPEAPSPEPLVQFLEHLGLDHIELDRSVGLETRVDWTYLRIMDAAVREQFFRAECEAGRMKSLHAFLLREAMTRWAEEPTLMSGFDYCS